jgi:Tfp pilus assembly protein PilX
VKEGKQFAGMGASSILMVFVLLCLTTFGILSFVTAHSDLNLTKKARDTDIAYYSAEALTTEAIAMIDGEINAVRTDTAAFNSSTSVPSDYKSRVIQKIEALTLPEGVEVEAKGDNKITITAEDKKSGQHMHTVIELNDITQKERYRLISGGIIHPN